MTHDQKVIKSHRNLNGLLVKQDSVDSLLVKTNSKKVQIGKKQALATSQ